MKRNKRAIIWITCLCVLLAMFPAASFAAWEHGDKGTADFTKILIGEDGKEYYINEDVKTVFYNSDGSKTTKPGNGRSKVRWRYLKITDQTDKSSRYGYCAEFGAGFDDTAPYKASDSAKDKTLFQNLPAGAQKIIGAALCYGRNGSRKVPVEGANDADYYFATQILIWEAQQGLRTVEKTDGTITGTKLAAAHSMPAKHMYSFLKGRPAEKCYKWLVGKVNGHLKAHSFASDTKAGASAHLMKYDKAAGVYSVTLTDTNKKSNGILISDSRIKVTKSGYTYKLETSSSFPDGVTLAVKNKIAGGSNAGKLLAWNCTSNASNQAMVTGSIDLTGMYLKLKTDVPSEVTLVKTDKETGKPVTSSSAAVQVTDLDTGKKEVSQLKTGKDGTAVLPKLYPGKYEIKEMQAPEGYLLKKDPLVFTVGAGLQTVKLEDMPQKGIIKIVKNGQLFSPDQGKMKESVLPLAKAVFEIFADEDIVSGDGSVRLKAGALADTLITDEEGNASSQELYLGKYRIIEKEAPSGYIRYSKPVFAELHYAGQETVLASTEVSLTNEQIKGSVEIEKTDVSTGEPLPDTGIEILDQDKKSILQTRTDDHGKAVFANLPAGVYYFREFDAPKGYEIDEQPFPFEIKENGMIVKCSMTNKALPGTPEKPQDHSPQTGDRFSAGMCILLLTASAVMIFLVIYRRRRY